MRLLVEAPRWLLLAALVYAPGAYGCTRPWTIVGLNALLDVLLLLWAAGLAARRRWPRIPALLAGAAAALLALGWLVALNAHASYAEDFHQFAPLASFWPKGPGSMNREVSLAFMWRATSLLGVLCFTVDLARRPRWRERLWWTLVMAGASVVALGLAQKFLEAPMIFWESGRTGQTFFATYFYHGNAGAFINLILPPAAGLVVSLFRKRGIHGAKAVAASALFLVIIGAFVNVSKAGMVIAVLLLVALGIWQLPRLTLNQESAGRPLKLAGIICAVLLICGIATGLAWDLMAKRWREMPGLMNADNQRVQMMKSCAGMVPKAGALGYGPGTFATVFPFLNPPDGPTGIWRYAHQDYLQTLIEWGWLGGALWAIVFAGGLFGAIRGHPRVIGRNRILLFVSSLALGGIALHALMDFPLQIASLQLYTCVLLAFGWSWREWERAPAV